VRRSKTPQPDDPKQFSHWKLLDRFIALLDEHGGAVAPSARENHGLRELDRQRYFGLFLFSLFNPVVASTRAACAATGIGKVQQALGLDGPVALAGFSDAQKVFSPEILEPVLGHLLAGSIARQTSGFKHARLTPELIHIFDSTVWKVVSRMDWAEWREQHGTQRAVRLHTKLRLCDLQPSQVEVGTGKTCERAAMRRMFKAGEFYLGDRNYGAEFAVFDELDALGCGFVLRLNNTVTYEVVRYNELSAEAKADGIILDAVVRLGYRGEGGLRRIVIKKTPEMKEELILVTNQTPDILDALEVVALYRHRWQIEMFFRWLKCLVPCRHWFAQSEEGVRIQIYLCLIKGLLLAAKLGSRPNKRMMELLQFHQMGLVGDGELAALLAREEAARSRRAAKKTA
jgi:hypothetical protein